MNYNYFRDYEPGTGRYVQSDPIGLSGGISTYLYSNGRPTLDSDQTGLATHIITTYDKILGIRYGSHSAIYIDGEHGQPPFLYDPAGHFVPPNADRGGGGAFEGEEADLNAYIKYHKDDGSEVVIVKLPTNAVNEQVIKKRADWNGDARGFTCASSVSYVAGGYCGGRISATSRPGILKEMADNAAQACRVK
ncbi:RHS repeat-associated core domain-containing protein [Lysobacter capsici]|uniref:RHS repeat-associated core domain-containing protein n=1 Tax=Lysobacter capsici TaxID=435897 RepID=UPI000BBA540E|nr:RHS repeat-associated core domain-containing protein [Lysobacter capsici]ATE70802.1 hypothetical protein CNO08_05140 [Lysobacter capsici]